MDKTIAIQGFEGCFHQEAAQQFFGNKISVACCSGFRELVKRTLTEKEITAAVMAIENSIAGSILPNYQLLQDPGLLITGEVYLRINQQLLVNPGVKLEDIREVHSHPMALLQCSVYLDQFNWKLVETDDTAGSARHIHQHHSRHMGAIAGKTAARLYGLEIIAPNIQTEKNNYTRFLVLERTKGVAVSEDADKASINFFTDHTRGSLATVLSKIAEAGINLSKLQSMPIPGGNWKYSFHADLEFEEPGQFYKVLEKIKPVTRGLTVYGIYKKGKP